MIPSISGRIVIAVHVVIIATMAVLILAPDYMRLSYLNLAVLFLPPMVAISTALSPMNTKARIVWYWICASAMVIPAGFGLLSGWGLLYAIGIIFLLWAALQENRNSVR